jgi:hypothetical protein
MAKELQVKDIIDLVEEIDSEDPIDWGMLNIDETQATELVANNLVEQYNTTWAHLPDDERNIIMLSTITKLVVENFTLNLKLMQR